MLKYNYGFKKYNCDCIQCRGDGWVADVFATTPKMSVYLVAFFVGEFEKLRANGRNGYEVICVTLPVFYVLSTLAYLLRGAINSCLHVLTISTEDTSLSLNIT